jgi:hypothetical protein
MRLPGHSQNRLFQCPSRGDDLFAPCGLEAADNAGHRPVGNIRVKVVRHADTPGCCQNTLAEGPERHLTRANRGPLK